MGKRMKGRKYRGMTQDDVDYASWLIGHRRSRKGTNSKITNVSHSTPKIKKNNKKKQKYTLVNGMKVFYGKAKEVIKRDPLPPIEWKISRLTDEELWEKQNIIKNTVEKLGDLVKTTTFKKYKMEDVIQRQHEFLDMIDIERLNRRQKRG